MLVGHVIANEQNFQDGLLSFDGTVLPAARRPLRWHKREKVMCDSLVAKVRRVPSSFAFVVLFIAAVCIVSVGCSGQKGEVAASDVMPLAARVDRLDGEVGIDRQTDLRTTARTSLRLTGGRLALTPRSLLALALCER